jgi:hypothetical protein
MVSIKVEGGYGWDSLSIGFSSGMKVNPVRRYTGGVVTFSRE